MLRSPAIWYPYAFPLTGKGCGFFGWFQRNHTKQGVVSLVGFKETTPSKLCKGGKRSLRVASRRFASLRVASRRFASLRVASRRFASLRVASRRFARVRQRKDTQGCGFFAWFQRNHTKQKNGKLVFFVFFKEKMEKKGAVLSCFQRKHESKNMAFKLET